MTLSASVCVVIYQKQTQTVNRSTQHWLPAGLVQPARWRLRRGAVPRRDAEGMCRSFRFPGGWSSALQTFVSNNLMALCGSFYLKRQKQERKFSAVKGIPVYPGSLLFPIDVEQSQENWCFFTRRLSREAQTAAPSASAAAPPRPGTWSVCCKLKNVTLSTDSM